MSNIVKHHERTSASARAFDMAELGAECASAESPAPEDSAQRILSDAERQAEDCRRDGWEAGFAEGKAALVAKLEREIAEDLRRVRTAEVAALVQALRTAVDEVTRARDRVVRDAKDQLVTLAVNIARVIIKREVAVTPEIAKLNVEEAVRLSARRTKLIVRVSETDMESLHALLGDAPLAAEDAPVEIVPSSEVGPGGCVVESASGAVDARVETQLREIERTLLGSDFAKATSDREAAHGG